MIVTILRHPGSRGARTLYERLSEALRPMRVGMADSGSIRRTRGSRYILNWGVSSNPERFAQQRLVFSNLPQAVGKCANKLLTLDLLNANQVAHVEYNTGTMREQVPQWLEQDGKIVVRHTLNGHSGAGIVIVRRGEEIPNALLYTRYFRKDAEYRVHVAFGSVISIQQKRKRNGFDNTNPLASLVRTHDNGWIFAINDLHCDRLGYRADLSDLAIRACNAVGAGHCAVDVLVRHATPRRELNMVVCEINSAPGIEAESTANAYVEAFVNSVRRL